MRSQLSHSTPTLIGGRTKPNVTADYILGLVDGEGCFYVLVQNPKNSSKYYVRAQTHFHIKMKEDDYELLDSVKEFFGCGAVYEQRDKRPNHKNCYRYTVSSNKDVYEKIVPFFTSNPLKSSKKKDFEIFCKISELIHEGYHLNEEGLEVIRELKMQMNNVGTRHVREIRSHGGNAKKP